MGSNRAMLTVKAPTLFSMKFSAMLMDAFQDSGTGFPIRYLFDGNIFNLRRLRAKTKVQTDVLDELLYADCTGSIKVTKEQLSMKLKESTENANSNGPPDSMTLTCSTCNRQFRARISLVSHQRTH